MKKIPVYSRSARFRALMSGLLSVRETEVSVAECVGDLIAGCWCGAYDCVVVDDVRLFMDGLNPVGRLRRQRCVSPKIFVVSADLTEETVVALLDAGVDQYVSLPVEPTRLLDKLCGRSGECGHD